MHEDLELDVGRADNRSNVLERQLARKDDAVGPAIARQNHARGVGARHLRRRVNPHARCDRSYELRGPEVLNDDRIDRGGRTCAHLVFEARELRVEHERIERYVPANASAVQKPHRFRQIARVEVLRSRARARAHEPEVDRVRPG